MIDKETIDKIQHANIDIDICKDDFVIIQSWDDVHEIEMIMNKSLMIFLIIGVFLTNIHHVIIVITQFIFIAMKKRIMLL